MILKTKSNLTLRSQHESEQRCPHVHISWQTPAALTPRLPHRRIQHFKVMASAGQAHPQPSAQRSCPGKRVSRATAPHASFGASTPASAPPVTALPRQAHPPLVNTGAADGRAEMAGARGGGARAGARGTAQFRLPHPAPPRLHPAPVLDPTPRPDPPPPPRPRRPATGPRAGVLRQARSAGGGRHRRLPPHTPPRPRAGRISPRASSQRPAPPPSAPPAQNGTADGRAAAGARRGGAPQPPLAPLPPVPRGPHPAPGLNHTPRPPSPPPRGPAGQQRDRRRARSGGAERRRGP